MTGQCRHRIPVAVLQQLLHGIVHLSRCLLRAIHIALTLQILVMDSGRCHQTQLIAHTIEGDHVLCQRGCSLDIVGSAGGLDTEHHLLRGSTAQQGTKLTQQLLLGGEVLFLLRQVHGIAQSTGGMGHDGDLGNRLRLFIQRSDQRVTHLVIGNQPLFRIGKDGVFLFCAGDHGLEGDHQILLIHRLASVAYCPQSGFVYQIGKVGTDGTGGCLRDLLQIHILGKLDLPGVYLQRVQSALQVGAVYDDPPVKTAGTQQRLVKDLGTVGGGKAYDALGGIEAVDFAQKLVQGLLLLGVAAVAVVTGAAHRIDLVNEDDARSHLCRLLEQVADPAGTHAHEHFHEVGAGDGEERHIGFACHSLSQQGLTGTGRAHQQSALGQLCADLGVFLGIVEEIDDLL